MHTEVTMKLVVQRYMFQKQILSFDNAAKFSDALLCCLNLNKKGILVQTKDENDLNRRA